MHVGFDAAHSLLALQRLLLLHRLSHNGQGLRIGLGWAEEAHQVRKGATEKVGTMRSIQVLHELRVSKRKNKIESLAGIAGTSQKHFIVSSCAVKKLKENRWSMSLL